MPQALPYIAYALMVVAAAAAYISNEKARKAAEKARKKAAEEEDARKGFDIVVETEAKPLPVVFGRNKIGGVRVYHQVNSTYNPPPVTDPNKTKTFDASQKVRFLTKYYERVWVSTPDRESEGYYTSVERFSYTIGGIFERAMSYRKRPALEYLFFQQVIASARINSIVDITIDGMDYNSPNFMTQPTPLEY